MYKRTDPESPVPEPNGGALDPHMDETWLAEAEAAAEIEADWEREGP
jgi:hypothetical protein